jgi:hypothetical protein
MRRIGWPGIIIGTAMVVLLVAMGFLLLPSHPDLYVIGVAGWTAAVIVAVIARANGWRWIDILKGDG